MATVYTSVGEAIITDYTTGDACAPANYYIGWGKGSTGADKGDSALEDPSDEARVIGAESQPLADKAQWIGTLTSASIQTITEAGLFDAAGSGTPPTGGNLIVYSVFTGIVLGIGDKIEFTITLEQT